MLITVPLMTWKTDDEADTYFDPERNEVVTSSKSIPDKVRKCAINPDKIVLAREGDEPGQTFVDLGETGPGEITVQLSFDEFMEVYTRSMK